MHLFTLGLNHHTAPLAVRERVAFPPDQTGNALAELHQRLARIVPESAIVSTCNRTEIYCAVREPTAARDALTEWLARVGGLTVNELRPHLYALGQQETVRHAFRVASGLDSMVLGEPQILGQMKEAARRAQDAGVLGTPLQQLFQRSFAVAKEVRSQTNIGLASVSMAAAAVRLARRIFNDLHDTRVLFIGAGQMTELAAAHFAAQHPREIAVASRTLERAERLARRFAAHALRLADVPERLGTFDVVVSCTNSSLPLIGTGMVERATRARATSQMLLIDLAVPRDIEPEVVDLPGVFLYCIDDLATVVQSGIESRRAAMAQAEAIIDKRVDLFRQWLAARRTVPLLQSLEERIAPLCTAEIQRARRLLARGEPAEVVLEALATGLANKFLHAPRALLAGGSLTPDEAQRLVEQWLPQRAAEHDPERVVRLTRAREMASAA
jgi:glutamyl-tRNA reductase